jgi:RNA polymerase sigma factor (sigma-70 family)
VDVPEHSPETVRARVADVFRLEYAQVVASVVRMLRDIDAAEEVVQEAFAQALVHWPADGVPERPGAWLCTTARRRALDRLRHRRRAGAHTEALAYEAELGAADDIPDVADPVTIPDDRLRLIFTCCHPALPVDSRVALTLRLVGGLSTVEIARAFLVPEPTIAQRLVRAAPEVLGLLALIELQASRATTRTDAAGNLVLLSDQDRRRWDRERIGHGLECLARADFLRRLGRWTDAAGAYREALRLADNPSERRFLGERLRQCEASAASSADSPPAR